MESSGKLSETRPKRPAVSTHTVGVVDLYIKGGGAEEERAKVDYGESMCLYLEEK